MSIKSILSAGLLASAAVAHTLSPRFAQRACGAPEPTEEQMLDAKLFAMKEEAARVDGTSTILADTVVDVYVHVLSTSTRPADGYLSDATVKAQIDVINSDYAGTGFSFVLKGTDRTVNTRWANDQDEVAMKKALRKGTYKSLNLYFKTSLSGYLGYCYFPTTAPSGSQDFILDGCSILASTVPGGSETGYNLGKTATHEMGHWFGLYHTFQGGCTGSGDFVSDTPAQSTPSSGCPVGRDSCPSQTGLDPIHNYMDYSDDACYEEFTAGQIARMKSQWTQYRA